MFQCHCIWKQFYIQESIYLLEDGFAWTIIVVESKLQGLFCNEIVEALILGHFSIDDEEGDDNSVVELR